MLTKQTQKENPELGSAQEKVPLHSGVRDHLLKGSSHRNRISEGESSHYGDVEDMIARDANGRRVSVA